MVVLSHVALTLFVCLLLYAQIFTEAWQQLSASSFTPKRAQIHKEAKTAKTMALILGVHMVSLIPYLVVVTMRYFVDDQEGSEKLSDAKKVR